MERNELRPLLRRMFPRQRDSLLPALHFLQQELGHLPEWTLQIVGWHLRVPASEVYGAATSYAELRIDPPGDHVIRVCQGVGCRYTGGGQLLGDLIAALGIQPGETTVDGSVTLEETPCGFLCPAAPAAQLDGHWIGRARAEGLIEHIQGTV